MSALGEEFRSAREARGLSLSDVAERLHIRSVYLAAIEEEDWQVIGAPVYVRGFVRTYARFLGLDPEAAVARFATLLPPPVPAAASRPAQSPGLTENKADAERSGPSRAAILAIVVAAAFVLSVGYEFYQYRTGTQSAVPAAEPSVVANADRGAPPAPAAGAASGVAEVPSPKPSPSAKPKRGLSVRVTETSWLRVTVDGKVLYEGTLPAGAAKSFTGKTADVRIGNAGGVSIAVNGHTLAPLGASGDVVERNFALSGE